MSVCQCQYHAKLFDSSVPAVLIYTGGGFYGNLTKCLKYKLAKNQGGHVKNYLVSVGLQVIIHCTTLVDHA